MRFLIIDWAGALNVAGFAFLMVFLLLIFIVLVLTLSGRFFVGLEKARKQPAGPVVELAESDAEAEVISGEVLAAISMALNVHYGDAHDIESNIITIVKGDKRYSPWSSKIYGLNVFRRN
jgi:glutaconyl-CoA/methylmalonyl-CoA decarboxylase subunit delta